MDLPRLSTCLVAENEALIAMMVEEQIQDYGLEVLGPFATCAAALAALATMTPDIAVIDYMLGDGPCTPIADELIRRGVPFAILSGYDVPLHENRTGWTGVRWLRKPLPMDALLRALRDLLAEP